MSSPIIMHTTGVIVIPLDPEAQNPGQALLLALITTISSMDDALVSQIDEDVRTATKLHQAGNPAFGPYYKVVPMAWAAFQEIRDEHKLIARDLGDDLD